MKKLYVLLHVLIILCNALYSKNEDILLMINYNVAYYNSIDFLKELYAPYFANIVFIGPVADPRVEHINHRKGFFGYKGIAHVMQKYPNYAGYLFINDDSILNCWNFDRFDRSKIWFRTMNIKTIGSHLINSGWVWWKTKWGLAPLKKSLADLPDAYKESLAKNIGAQKCAFAFSDVVYFPAQFKDDVIALADHFAKYNLFLEIAIPMICSALSPIKDIEIMRCLYLWGNDRKNVFKRYTKELDFIHPIKLSSLENREFVLQQYT